jgi:CBS domain-containing protein
LFTDTTVGKLLFNQKDSITISCETHVDKALELMVKYGISSLPVRSKDDQSFQGILNMSDIIAHLSYKSMIL